MISMLKGNIDEKIESKIVLDVKGVGYLINLPANSIFFLSEMGDSVKIFVHMLVREDDMSLYGFEDRKALDFFEKLILVNGVGPKAGLAILEIGDIDSILAAIVNNDAAFISIAKGIGKKTADRICLELSDKINLGEGPVSLNQQKTNEVNSNKKDAVLALMSLGYKEFEAKKLIDKIDADALSTEEYIRIALKG
ncbi:MAG: Holliday junction branch migration protein RuvA [Clostridiales Family XIII bacterium]|jgi:Holliday junction DNA helicase RuvA|nr:Holliday junction branch migration protein RuvA [Clostridiales Family XIII bacterium]